MTAKQFSALLKDLGACSEATKWADGKTLSIVWKSCTRADWLLWLCGKMADKPGWPTRKQVVLAACACAETALEHVPEGEMRPRQAIETARRWARGKASLEDVRDAASAAYAASASAYAADAAYAASAAYASAYAADAAYAASAAYAADAAYASASASKGRIKTLAELADIVRRVLKAPRPKSVSSK